MNIKIEELVKVSYLKVTKLDGRAIPMFACYQGNGTWEQWVPQNENLIRLKITRLIEGRYYAKEPESQNDLFLPSIDFFHKRMYWSDTTFKIEALYNDITNLFASLKKLEIINDAKNKYHGIHNIVITEVEYQFLLCRSMYDLLQEIIICIWDKVKFVDTSIKKQQLPSSFRKMVIRDDKKMSKDEIKKKFKIPEVLAEFYEAQSDFFLWLRAFRDLIAHRGNSIDIVFATENGFAIQTNIKPFNYLKIWNDKNTLPNNLGSVKAFISYLILNTLNTIEVFYRVISKLFQFPYDVAPEYSLFLKDSNYISLQSLEENITSNAWY